jgi:biotin carboxyl carrier protein
MNWDKFTRFMQIGAAALAIPAGAAGVYSAYRTHFTNDAACEKLRNAILTTMEKNLAAETKHPLLRRDVSNFEKSCGEIDPDAGAIFQASIQQLEIDMAGKSLRQAAMQTAAAQPQAQPQPQPQPEAQSQPAPVPAARPQAPQARPAQAEPRETRLAQAAAGSVPAALPRPQLPPVASAAAVARGDVVGWVALGRVGVVRFGGVNFDGYPISAQSLPPPGTILTARWPVPVWTDLQEGIRPDLSGARAMLRPGMCVRVISTRAGLGRLWAEVTQAGCL